jgi:hypothetical protein
VDGQSFEHAEFKGLAQRSNGCGRLRLGVARPAHARHRGRAEGWAAARRRNWAFCATCKFTLHARATRRHQDERFGSG